jgi:catechol 2,3-dioxygenase-like lactoylglutathione lyase family enzyme
MISRFDHAVIAVRDLDEAMRAYSRLGFAVSRGGRHPGRGTQNAIIRFGLDYLELLALSDEREARAAGMGDAALRGFQRGGLVDYALASDDLDADIVRLRAAGLDVQGPFDGSRRRPDGTLLAWKTATIAQAVSGFAHVRDPWPFLIQWLTPDAERAAGDQPGAQPNGTTRMWGVSVIARDLDAALAGYERGLGLDLAGRAPLGDMAAERARFTVGGARLDVLGSTGEGFVSQALASAGEGPFSITLATPDLEATGRYLTQAGVPFSPTSDPADELLIAPEAACGARLIVRAEVA